jgi:hypothetical protein
LKLSKSILIIYWNKKFNSKKCVQIT